MIMRCLLLYFTLGIITVTRGQEAMPQEPLIPRENFVSSPFFDIRDIKVRRMDGSKVTGRLIYLDRNRIVLTATSGKRQTTLRVQEIQSVYVRPKGAMGIGILAGLAVGSVTGYVAGSATSDTSGAMPSLSGAKIAGIAGISGALIGGLIGSKRTRYPIDGKPNLLTDLGLRLSLEKSH